MAPTASQQWVRADALSGLLAWFVFREKFDRRIALGMAFAQAISGIPMGASMWPSTLTA